MTQTLTTGSGQVRLDGARAVVHGAQLILVMNCAEPTRRPARFSLAFVNEVHIGRGAARKCERSGETSDTARLRICVPDDFMSGAHVRLFSAGGKWFAEDAGSKNGTCLNDDALKRSVLDDGDLIVTGNTIFLFRADMPVFEDEVDVDLSATAVNDAATTTLHTPYAADLSRLSRIAPSAVPILVRGDTGTGKELVARAIHAQSGRSGPFVAVNCGALPPSLITSELFGAKKGAYSGATENRAGLVRSADGGTLFLDEIAELPLEAQAAFLRVLQESEVVPVGGDRPIAVDIRLVAATHQDLSTLVTAGTFREDLFARVAGYEIALPPLRERREDIGLIVGTILAREGREDTKLTSTAARALFDHHWPRNVRELEHALLAACAVAGKDPIEVEHLPPTVREPVPMTTPEAERPDGDTKESFAALARKADGNVSAIARALGTSRSQVRRLAKRHDIDISRFRK